MTNIGKHEQRCIELEQLILEERTVNSDLEISFLRRSWYSSQEGEYHSCYSEAESPDNADLQYHIADKRVSDFLLFLLSAINCIQYYRLIERIVRNQVRNVRWLA